MRNLPHPRPLPYAQPGTPVSNSQTNPQVTDKGLTGSVGRVQLHADGGYPRRFTAQLAYESA